MADTNISNIDIKTHLHSWIQQKIHPSSSHPPTFGFPASVSWSASLTLAWDRKRCKDPDQFRIVVSASEWTYAKETCWTHAEPIWKLHAVHQKTPAKSGSNHIQSFFQPNATCCTWPVLTCSYLFVEIVWNCDLKIPLLSLQFFNILYISLRASIIPQFSDPRQSLATSIRPHWAHPAVSHSSWPGRPNVWTHWLTNAIDSQ